MTNIHNKLEPIILQKQHEVAALKQMAILYPENNMAKIMRGEIARGSQKSFKHALCHPTLSIIAEIKRKSPSRGVIAEINDPIELAESYVAGHANAISVLTDTTFFGGTLSDLAEIAKKFRANPITILRKDFILDEIQIAESIAAGADAILAIVAVLGKQTKIILERARDFNIDVLVEVHNHEELNIALDSGAVIIGVNNRNLNTFEVDTEQSLRLISDIPAHIIKVAESGIHTPELAREYYVAGFNAVLIGEALIKSTHPEAFIKACRDEK